MGEKELFPFGWRENANGVVSGDVEIHVRESVKEGSIGKGVGTPDNVEPEKRVMHERTEGAKPQFSRAAGCT
ncbi:MAG: hypothetical protein D6707_12010 [Bacteroidetes bacterium]|nr:MAG: hypothetical protein D6707_12010 [Bacteroidota bacterium]